MANAAVTTADHRFVLDQAIIAAGNMMKRIQECTRVRTGVSTAVTVSSVAVAVRDDCDSNDDDDGPIMRDFSAVSGMVIMGLEEEITPLTRRLTFSM